MNTGTLVFLTILSFVGGVFLRTPLTIFGVFILAELTLYIVVFHLRRFGESWHR